MWLNNIRIEGPHAFVASAYGGVLIKEGDAMRKAGDEQGAMRKFIFAERLGRLTLERVAAADEAAYLTGASLARQGRWKEALPFMERALKLIPDYETYKEGVRMVKEHIQDSAPPAPAPAPWPPQP
jgi:tetratricopeptide (TPR) repeat protein